MATVTLSKETAVKLFKEIGFENAASWDKERLLKRLKNISNNIDADTKIADEELDKLLDALLEADKIKIAEDEEEKPAKTKKKPAPKKKTLSKKIEELPEKKAEKEKKKNTTTSTNKPGVIATIIHSLKQGPVTRNAIAKKLAEKFPERDAAAMKRTVSRQVPHLLNKERSLNVVKTDEGYKIEGYAAKKGE